MKRIALLLLICSLLTLTSCSGKVDAAAVIREFCAQYPLDARVYSSLAGKGEDGYIDDEMLSLLYGSKERPTEEFALALYGKVDTVREIGVFVIRNGDDTIELIETLNKRISFLSSCSDGEGVVRKYKGALVYAFVRDADHAIEIFDGII